MVTPQSQIPASSTPGAFGRLDDEDDVRLYRLARSIEHGRIARVGLDYLQSVTREIASALRVRHAVVVELREGDLLGVLAANGAGAPDPGVEYSIRGTPCEEVFKHEVRTYRSRVQDHFPDAEVLRSLNAESYVGVVLRGSDGDPLGLLALIDDKPLTCPAFAQELLSLLAPRASAELARLRAESALAESEQHYRELTEGSVQGVLIGTLDQTLFANEAYAKLLGYDSNAEILALPSVEVLYSPHERERLWRYYQARISGELAPSFYEYDAQRKDGSTITLQNVARAITWRGRQAVQSTVMDVTERRRAYEARRESEERYRNLVNGSVQGLFIHRNWKLLFVNETFVRMLDYGSPDEMIAIGDKVRFIADHDVDRLREYKEARERGESAPERYEYDAIRKDGSIMRAELMVRVVNWEGEFAIQNTVFDISDRSRAERALRSSEQRFRDFAETAADWFWEADAQGRLTYLSERYEGVTGYDREQVLGATRRERFESWGIDVDRYASHFADLAAERPFQDFDYERVLPNGSLQVHRLSGKPVYDERGRFNGYRGVGRDVTQSYQLARQMEHQATHDALTGLVNRVEFEQRLARVIETARAGQSVHALCCLDLDRFKLINDTCGHLAGDEFLRQLSTVLQQRVRKRDTLARIGGDEFAVLIEHCPLERAERLAGELLDAVHGIRFVWEGKTFRIGVSIGLMPIDAASRSATDVLRDADAACYAAKDQGRDRIHVWKADDDEFIRRQGEVQWAVRIQRALENDGLELGVQQIVALRADGNEPLCHELLVRMHDGGEVVRAESFLPAAERYGLATRIDRWVLAEAIASIAEDRRGLIGKGLCFVNISGQSLNDADLPDFVLGELSRVKLDPTRLCLELTETATFANLSSAIQMMSTLRDAGCRFALDDFGSGFSSFGYLRTLPVDFLKIDGSFVRDIADDPVDRVLVKSINEMGHAMGKQTIAEFVEVPEVLAVLREIGVNYAQGYLLGETTWLGTRSTSASPRG